MSFIDKKQRIIDIEVDYDRATARDNGREIGFVQITGGFELDKSGMSERAEITGWDVNSDYRRAGIATELVRVLFEDFGELLPPKKNEGIGGMNTLTEDGYAITKHCQKLGYVSPFPDEVPDHDDDPLDI